MKFNSRWIQGSPWKCRVGWRDSGPHCRRPHLFDMFRQISRPHWKGEPFERMDKNVKFRTKSSSCYVVESWLNIHIPIEIWSGCHYFTFKDTQVFDIKGSMPAGAVQVKILKYIFIISKDWYLNYHRSPIYCLDIQIGHKYICFCDRVNT